MSTTGDHYFTSAPAAPAQHRPLSVTLGGAPRSLSTAAGIFSADRLDAGTSVLLDAVPAPPPRGTLVDLGCGWGPIALTMALASPAASVLAVDVNTRALDLAAANAAALGLTGVRTLTPEQVPGDLRVDALWSNPPVRVGKAVLHEMLRTWLPRLREGAAAHLVVHRHLGSDSLARWVAEQELLVPLAGGQSGGGGLGGGRQTVRAAVERVTSVDGYRVLRVTVHPG